MGNRSTFFPALVLTVMGLLLSLQNGYAEELKTPPEVSGFLKQVRAANWKSAERALSFPLRVVHTAYEVGTGSCARHYEDLSANRLDPGLHGDLIRLAKAFEAGEVVRIDDGAYAVIGATGDCEHVWSIHLSKESRKIDRLQMDAGDNAWRPGRRAFKRTD
jgi:hypothetical protein